MLHDPQMAYIGLLGLGVLVTAVIYRTSFSNPRTSDKVIANEYR